MATIGDAIRVRRGELDMTEAQAAEKAGISRTAWSDIERGAVRRPRPATLAKMAAALDTTMTGLRRSEAAPATAVTGNPQHAQVIELWDRMAAEDRVRIFSEMVSATITARGFGAVHEAALAGVR